MGDLERDFFFRRPMSEPLSLPLPSECFLFLVASVSDSLSETPFLSVGSASEPGLLDLDLLGDLVLDLDLDGDLEAAGLLDLARVGLPELERAGLPDLLLAGEPVDLAGLADLDFGESAADLGDTPSADLGEPVLDLGENVLQELVHLGLCRHQESQPILLLPDRRFLSQHCKHSNQPLLSLPTS